MNIKYVISKAIDKRISKEKRNDIKYYFKIGFTLLVISAVTASMLAFVNELTKDRIKQNELAVMQEAIGRIFAESDKVEEIEGEYNSPIVAVYEVYKGEQLLGHCVQSAPVGFKDKIGLIIGIDNERKCVGVEVTSLSDTPGVGTKVKDKTFLESFVGYDASNVGEVDTISGATISSAAVKDGIEEALRYSFEENTGEEEYTEQTNNNADEENLIGDLFDEPIEEDFDATEENEQTEDQNEEIPSSSDGGVA